LIVEVVKAEEAGVLRSVLRGVCHVKGALALGMRFTKQSCFLSLH